MLRHLILPIVLAASLAPIRWHQRTTEALEIEVIISRDLMLPLPTQPVILDSMFSAAGAAPGHPTRASRPHLRTVALSDSLAAGRHAGRDSVKLLLSAPDIRVDTAHITGTKFVAGRLLPDGRRLVDYETVEYLLVRDRGHWSIRTRQQLGIS